MQCLPCRAHPTNRGFTLIELLVVVAIIGMLASVVIAALGNTRAKARDARRLADLKQLQTALELYATDNNGLYPSTSLQWWGNCATFGSHGTSGATGWIPNLAPTYIANLPLDPRAVPPTNCYLYRSDGRDYMILAYATVETYTTANNPQPRPLVPGEPDFAIYTVGATNW